MVDEGAIKFHPAHDERPLEARRFGEVACRLIAWREIRQLSTPVATGQLETDRSQYDIVPGDVRELSWARLGITRLPIRVTKVNRGRILDNKIRIDWAQDVFSFNASTFADPTDTNWQEPDTDANANAAEQLIEVPYRITDDGTGANVTDLQVGTLVVRGGATEVGYNTYATQDPNPPTIPADPTVNDIIPPGGSQAFTPSGLLTAALDAGQTNGFQDTIGFTVDTATDMNLVQNATAAQVENRQNVLIVDGEIMLFETMAWPAPRTTETPMPMPALRTRFPVAVTSRRYLPQPIWMPTPGAPSTRLAATSVSASTAIPMPCDELFLGRTRLRTRLP